MKDLGHLKYFLGLEVACSAEGFYLCQRKYCTDVVTEVGILVCKPAGFPMDKRHGVSLAKGSPLPDPERYRRLVGRLVYLAATRPDLTYSIHILTQFMQKLDNAHWDGGMHVVRYLKCTLGEGIMLREPPPLHITGWSDSDWEGCPVTQRSLTGWLVQLGTSIISWKTKKQGTVALSSTEAEYRPMTEAVKELKWIKGLLRDFGIDHTRPMTLMCDDQSANLLDQESCFP